MSRKGGSSTSRSAAASMQLGVFGLGKLADLAQTPMEFTPSNRGERRRTEKILKREMKRNRGNQDS